MTKIVGILNITPDSFSDGGKWNAPEVAFERVDMLFAEGADIIDIGAESTRPKAHTVQVRNEWQRLSPVIGLLRERYPADKFSIDTRHARVASLAIHNWSDELIINDVSGAHDPDMVGLVAQKGSFIVVGHLPAEANGDIQKAHNVQETSLDKVVTEIHEKIDGIIEEGVDPSKIVVDPGIGFGKEQGLNWQLLEFAKYTEYPTMIGHSQKGFLGNQRYSSEYNAEIGRIAANAGAAYIRVHDVAAHAANL